MSTEQTLHRVFAEIPAALAEIASELDDVVVTEDRLAGTAQIAVFNEDPEEARAGFARAAQALGLELKPEEIVVKQEDWANSWKRFFKVMHVSPRIVIRPPWEEYTPLENERVITIDPGMSFGTGKHETTKSCILFLDEIAAELDPAQTTVLDMGCGSGILAIAAKLLGFEDVSAFDNDPDAVRIAAENAAENGVDFEIAVGDAADPRKKADIVLANILAPILIENAAAIANSAEKLLVLSGILDTQYAAVREAYELRGFVEERSVLLGEWRSGLFKRNA